jgi:DNA-binding SARP family transcriptional activator
MTVQALRLSGSDSQLTLRTLGEWVLVQSEHGGAPTPVLGPSKPLALLVYLALSPGCTARREHLIDLLWADLHPDAAGHALRQTVWYIRQRTGLDVLRSAGGTLTLAAPIATDRDDFLGFVEALDLEHAVQHYGGEFLPGFAAPGGMEFERWADLERTRLRGVFVRSAESLSRQYLASSRFRDAVALARRARAADPMSEGSWRLLLECLVSSGDWIGAAAEADALEQLLRDEERSVEPSTRAALRTARQQPTSSGPEVTARTLVAELVGREREFGEIIAAWDEARHGGACHVHVTAAAGLGKSRLLSDVHNRLRAGGARCVLLRANPGEQHLPYAFASDLAAALTRLQGAAGVAPATAGALVALNPTLSARYPSAAPDVASGAEALRRRTLALAETFVAVAEDSPVAVLVDDVHWVDGASRQILAGVLGRLERERVLLVTTSRAVADGTLERTDTQKLDLDPLTPPQVAAVLASLGTLPDEPWAHDLGTHLYATSRGSPLLLLETMQLAIERGALTLGSDGWVADDPEGLETILAAGGALRRRVEELDRHQGWLLLLLAVAGRPLPPALICHATQRGRSEVDADLCVLEQRGLVTHVDGAWLPGHDAVAEVALDAATGEALRSAHTAVGQVLAIQAGGDTVRLALAGQHFAAAREEASLRSVFRRYATAMRRRGDRRSFAELAGELLGVRGSPAEKLRLLRRLPWRVRLGLYTPARLTLAWLAMLVLGASAAALLLVPRTPVSENVLLVTVEDSAQGPTVMALSLPSSIDAWDDLAAATLREPPRRMKALVGNFLPPGGGFYSPASGAWIVGRVSPDSGGDDLYVRWPDGREERLTSTPGDDGGGSWSPDGSRLVFQTGRWSGRSWYDLAVMDLRTRRVRRLTHADATEHGALWSPDGMRIAFASRFIGPVRRARPSQVCWIPQDGGAPPRCRELAGVDPLDLLAWYDDHQVIATVASGDSTLVARLDLDNGAFVPLRGAVEAAASADGRWVAGLLALSATDHPSLAIFPTNREDLARYVTDPRGRRITTFQFLQLRTPPPRAVAITIEGPQAAVPPGGTARFGVVGRALDRARVALPPVVTWATSDTTLATIGSESGVITARRPGQVTVRASAGGWLHDSIPVTISSERARTVLAEDWSRGLGEQWMPFGEPGPQVVRGPGASRVLWARGDSAYTSGVHSRRGFETRSGLGLDVRIASPITETQWQVVRVEFGTVARPDSLLSWDHRTGSPPARRDVCGFYLPAGEGFSNVGRASAGNRLELRLLAAAPQLTSGRWYTVRLQLFEDGRCGVAVNGRPLWRSRTSVDRSAQLRVFLHAMSYGTRVEYGPVEVWEGVREGVDWSLLDNPPQPVAASAALSPAARAARTSAAPDPRRPDGAGRSSARGP